MSNGSQGSQTIEIFTQYRVRLPRSQTRVLTSGTPFDRNGRVILGSGIGGIRS